ncbi:MAG: leucyl aminopeptidase family protein [Gammaproteobacteria bacterium]|nr:leucyl aminopeptidase family protein [Gammaproteobacteria bacterium]
MQADKFYRESEHNAVQINFVTGAQWQKLATSYASQLTWQTFNAQVGEVLLVLNQEGRLEKVLLGVQENKYFLAIAQAALRLPKGSYALAEDVSDHDVLAWGLAQYKFVRYKANHSEPRVLHLSRQQLAVVSVLCDAVYKVRDLINTPAEDMGPKDLGDVLKSLAQRFRGQFSNIVGDDLLSENFPAIHAVGRAALQAPRLLRLTWGKTKDPLVCLVGKGVCFDSGGLDLKPASGMRTMKKDMGGAAQVIGLAQLIMHFALPVRLEVFIPAVENAIDGEAYRPGDIIRMRNGLHVEIDNTDAEGRLVLADALVLASELNPKMILDFATLTGAARTAVGTEISAVFSNDRDLAAQLMQMGEVCRDPVWQLPLYEPYYTMFDSTIADMCNSSSSPYAGAITAALFLKRFIGNDIPWAHFDLMAWNVSSKPGKPEGGEAMACLATFAYIQQMFTA